MSASPAAPQIARIDLVVSTPVHPNATARSIADAVRGDAAVAAKQAAVLERLADAGWALDAQPRSEQGYTDVVIAARKSFPDEQTADLEAVTCGAAAELNFSFGWNEVDGDVAWWAEPGAAADA